MPKASATRVRSKPLEWLGTKARALISYVSRLIFRLIMLVIVVIVISGWFGAMTGHGNDIAKSAREASESSYLAASQWLQVAILLLQSALGVYQATYVFLQPAVSAIWPLIRPLFEFVYDRLVLPAWVFVLPYLILAWDGFKSAIYAAASMLWERIVTADPQTVLMCIGMLVLAVVLLFVKRKIERYQFVSRIHNWFAERWQRVSTAVSSRCKAIETSVRAKSEAAARVFRLVAKFAALISIFILVLIVRCWFPLPIERLCGSMELSFAFVVLPAIGPANMALRRKNAPPIVTWLQYAVSAASLLLLWRTVPYAHKLDMYMPLVGEIKLSILLWVLVPFTQGSDTVVNMVSMVLDYALGSKLLEAQDLAQNTSRLQNMVWAALFFLKQQHRDFLTSIAQDGKVLCFLFFFPTPSSFVARLGFLMAGLGYPVYRSIQVLAKKKQQSDTSRRPVDESSIEFTNDQLSQWLIYWVIFALAQVGAEVAVGKMAGWIPLYWHGWLLFVIFLQLPYFNGARYMYEAFYYAILVKKTKKPIDAAQQEDTRLTASASVEDLAGPSELNIGAPASPAAGEQTLKADLRKTD